MNGNPAAVDRVEALAASLLGVISATGLMMAGFHLAQPRIDPEVVARLTAMGRDWFRPEHDMKIYIAGCALAVALAALLTAGPGRRSVREGAAGAVPGGRAGRLAFLTAAVIACGMLGLKFRQPRPVSEVLPQFGVWIVLMIAAAVVGVILGYPASLPGDRWFGSLGRRLAGLPVGEPPAGGQPAREGRAALVFFGLSILVVIVSVIIPRGDQLAGRFLGVDMVPFHHWDYFAMGPALGYAAGGALGTEVYSQYGVLWPMLLAGAMRISPSGYGLAVSLGSVYVCAFYLGLLFLLRSATGSLVWAGAGTILALNLQMFMGVPPYSTIWMTPSCTDLRSPMAVWAFYAIWKHATTAGPSWLVAAGIAAGLEVLFESDTGVYLVASLSVYILWFLICSPVPRTRRRIGTLGLAVLAMAATIAGGLAVASRGTITGADFWLGWTEGPRAYAGGMSAMPVADIVKVRWLYLFAGITAGYLLAVSVLFCRAWGRSAGPKAAVAGSLGIYGLTTMLLFVNRSHPWNLFHPCIPIVALATCVLAAARGAVPERFRQASAFAAWAAVVAALIVNPNYRTYPSILRQAIAPRPAPGLSLGAGVSDIPPSAGGLVAEFVAEFEGVTRRLGDLNGGGHSVGVLDPSDTVYYLASGVPPGDRYSPARPGRTRSPSGLNACGLPGRSGSRCDPRRIVGNSSWSRPSTTTTRSIS